MTLPYLAKQFEEDHIILRTSMKEHVQALRKYMINGMDKKRVFLPMIVANKTSEGKLQIIDGSTRVRAIYSLYQYLQNKEDDEKHTKAKVYFENSSLGIQVFHDLTEEQCNQLYIDFNTRGKKVALSKLIEYDSRHLDNIITNRILETNSQMKEAGIETEKRAVIRPTNKNFLSLSQLRQLVNIFTTGKHILSNQENTQKYLLKEQDYVELVNSWINEIFLWEKPKEIGNYQHTMLASFPVMISIAYFVNEDMIHKPLETRLSFMKARMRTLAEIDWSSHHADWRQFKGSYRHAANLYFLSNEPATIKQLLQWYSRIEIKEVM